MENSCRLPGL